MSDLEESGIQLFHSGYTKEAILAQAKEQGLPVALIQKQLELLIEKLYQNGWVFGQTSSREVQDRLWRTHDEKKHVFLRIK